MSEFICPECAAQPKSSRQFEVANCGFVAHKGLHDEPDEGSIVICPGCAAVLIIRDDGARRLTFDDWFTIRHDDTLREALRAGQAGVKKRLAADT